MALKAANIHLTPSSLETADIHIDIDSLIFLTFEAKIRKNVDIIVLLFRDISVPSR